VGEERAERRGPRAEPFAARSFGGCKRSGCKRSGSPPALTSHPPASAAEVSLLLGRANGGGAEEQRAQRRNAAGA